MSRPLRVEYPDAWYHVMNRGAAYQDIFLADDHRVLFLDLLREIGDLFGLECHAYCLMDNHYHLLIDTPRGNVSRGMRHLNGVYTQRFNRLEKRDGPLFRERIKSALSAEKDYSEIPEHRQLSTVPTIDHIKNVCATQFGINVADLKKDGRGGHGEPRTLAIALCRLAGGYPLTEIGMAFGGISYMGVSSAIARVRQRLENDPLFARRVSEIQKKLKGQ